MGLKPGYKQTEVGVIPEEWEVCRLDSLGAGSVPPIKAGPFGSSLTKDTYIPTGFKVYGQEQVIRGDYLYGDYFISPSKYRELESCAVSPGDVLLSLVGTAGKLLVVPDDAPAGVINPRLIRFSFDKKRVCPQFFKDLFETGQVQSFLARYAQGGTMGVLNAGMLRPVNIPLPPLPEQRAIAAALSDVDALISALDKLIAKKGDVKQAAMQQLLTGKQRLPGFSGEWEVKRLRDCLVSRPDYGINAPAVPFSDRLPSYIRITDISEHGRFSPDQRVSVKAANSDQFFLREGDLVFARTGASVGKSCLYDSRNGQLVFAGFLIRVRPNPEILVSAFLAAYATTKTYWNWVRLMSMRSGQPGINGNEYALLPILLPPVPEQTAIATVLSDMDAEIAALEQKRDKTRLLKQGMMQELLTGRTRLIAKPRSHE